MQGKRQRDKHFSLATPAENGSSTQSEILLLAYPVGQGHAPMQCTGNSIKEG